MTPRAGRAARLAARSGVVLLCVAVWYATLAPASIGGPLSLVLVRGTSMEPTYATGDVVVGYRLGMPSVGDVVVFRGPGGAPVIHRLRALDGERLVTRGDNLPADDPWETHEDDVLGTARVHVPGAGRVVLMFGRPAALGILCGLLVLLLVGLAVSRSGRLRDGGLWQRPPGHVVGVLAVLVAWGGGWVLGRAADLTLTADALASFVETGPFPTYVEAPGAGNGGGGGTGGGRP